MAQEHVEVITALVDALNRGDVDAALTAFHPDCRSATSAVAHGTTA